MIEVQNLSKRYCDKLAVDGLSFVVQPGMVTGFLGPNGAGKSTTMRLIAGLDAPTSGTVAVNGRQYRVDLSACSASEFEGYASTQAATWTGSSQARQLRSPCGGGSLPCWCRPARHATRATA